MSSSSIHIVSINVERNKIRIIFIGRFPGENGNGKKKLFRNSPMNNLKLKSIWFHLMSLHFSRGYFMKLTEQKKMEQTTQR